MLLARKKVTVEKEGTTIELKTREATTSGLRVGLQCDRGARIHQVLATGDGGNWVEWPGKVGARFDAPDGAVKLTKVRIDA
jgi:hypothetical protein